MRRRGGGGREKEKEKKKGGGDQKELLKSTTLSPSDCSGLAEPKGNSSASCSSCSLDAWSGLLHTNQRVLVVHGGVVNDPSYV